MRVMNSTGWGVLVMWAILIFLFILTMTACKEPDRDPVRTRLQSYFDLAEGDIVCVEVPNKAAESYVCQHFPSKRIFSCTAWTNGKASCIEGQINLGGTQ